MDVAFVVLCFSLTQGAKVVHFYLTVLLLLMQHIKTRLKSTYCFFFSTFFFKISFDF